MTRGRGGSSSRADVSNESAYFEFQVEKTALGVPGNLQPTYPSMLRSAGVEGLVLAQFVVDTSGKADMSTFKVLESSHELFSQAVRQALPSYRFFPAEIGGRKVRQVLQQPFTFALGTESPRASQSKTVPAWDAGPMVERDCPQPWAFG